MSIRNVGMVYRKKGDFEKALLQNHKALEIQTHLFGSQHLSLAASYGTIGGIYTHQRDFGRALVHHQMQKALELLLAECGHGHAKVTCVANVLLMCC